MPAASAAASEGGDSLRVDRVDHEHVDAARDQILDVVVLLGDVAVGVGVEQFVALCLCLGLGRIGERDIERALLGRLAEADLQGAVHHGRVLGRIVTWHGAAGERQCHGSPESDS